MKRNQNQAFRHLLMATLLTGGVMSSMAQGQKAVLPTDSLTNQPNGKEVKNRNVMLGAGDSTTPRTLNIGLPFTGDILINENDIPVVYTFWTQIPTTCWRYDTSLGNMGVMSFAEGALTYGKVGYIVQSWDREPGRKLRGFASIKGSTEGNFAVDMNLTAPLGNGWGLSLSMNDTRNKGPFKDYGFTEYQDRYDGFKAGIHKKYKRGKINFLYKYAFAKPTTGSYTPYKYLGNGKTEAFPGFNPGRTSYIVGDGYFPYIDFFTGKQKTARMGDDETAGNTSHAFYLYGDHRFDGGYKLKYSAMYQHSRVALCMQYPATLYATAAEAMGGMPLTLDDGTEWTGATQMVAAQYYSPVSINQFMAKVELTKKFGQHNLRLGTTYMHYHAPIQTNQGVYLQTVEEKPRILSLYGSKCLSGVGGYSKENTNKNAIYISDDFSVGRLLTGNVGARLEHQMGNNWSFAYYNCNMVNQVTTYDPTTWQPTTTTVDLSKKNPYFKDNYKGKFNYVLTGSFIAKLTKPFGIVGEATYNRFYQSYTDFAADQKDEKGFPKDQYNSRRDQKFDNYSGVLNLGAGVYLNIGSYLNLVSKVTYITKTNNIVEETVYSGNDTYKVYPVKYNISTIGWTTDIMSSYKNFNMHFLLTLQNPKYKDYTYKTQAGEEISYSDKNVTALSKVLIELDPSYYLFNRSVRLWASARYFGKQYGNKTNTVSYKGWWETFCGVDWTVNRNIDLKVQMCNILNYKGVTGSMIGADQITNESQMIGKYFVAEQIRPRAIEFTAAFKF